MKEFYLSTILAGALSFLLFSCQSNTSSELKDALTFYASFDEGTAADFALGDTEMYTANSSYVDSKRKLEGIQTGMNNPDHRLVDGVGQFGDAFEFGSKSSKVIFYKSKDNITYSPKDWSGSISFWLRLDPSTDLDGYSDPIQITDANYNDAAIWVDFTDDNPPGFRLGVFGDKNIWTQDTLNSSAKIEFEKRLVSIKNPPFTKNSWTHVVIAYRSLGTAESLSSLYLNGAKIGSISGVDDPFTWELGESNIFLGLNYSGLMDELSIFNKPLTDNQVKEIYQLKEGIKSIL